MSPFELHVPVLSLIDEHLKPIQPLIEAHISWLKSHHVDGILVMGTTGEFPHFSVSERQRYLEAVLATKPDFRVMVNIGSASLSDTLALQQHALSCTGVTDLLWMPPFYFPSEVINGLPLMLQCLLSHQPEQIPFYLYHYPQMSQVSIDAHLLADFPQVKGMKDSSGDFTRIEAMVKRLPDKAIYVGTDTQMQQSIQLGCKGAISGLANLFPQLSQQAIAGHPEAEAQLKALRRLFTTTSKMPALKAYLNHLALSEVKTSLTLPFTDISQEDSQRLWQAAQEIVASEAARYAG